MYYVNGSLIKNINETKLNQFLKDNNCIRNDGQRGQDIKFWLEDLINKRKINTETLNDFFFDELFYGKSNMMNIYKIKSCKNLIDEESWIDGLSEAYDIDSINFNNIMSTGVNPDAPEKIAAFRTSFDEERKITSVKMILVKFIRAFVNGKEGDSCCYLAIDFNLEKNLLIIKVRNRHYIPRKEHRPKASIEKVVNTLKWEMDFETKLFDDDHQKVLYKMSKGLLEELYQSIPYYNDVHNMEDHIEEFIEKTIKNIKINNIIRYPDGKTEINLGVIDLKDELNKVLQQLIVSDYFLNEDIDIFSRNNISAVITSIKFNDKEKNTAKLAGENNTKAIVCSRTFMSMRKSIEVVETVSALSIAYKRTTDSIEVKFDASEKEYLCITILNQKYYDELDFKKIWGIYSRYESKAFDKNTKLCEENVG